MDDEETTPLSILRPCEQCGNEFATIDQICANCQVERLCAVRRNVELARVTDWPSDPDDEYSVRLFHDKTMKQSYRHVEQARSVHAHMPLTVQIAHVMNRAYQEFPDFWGLVAQPRQGDIPL